MGSEVSGWELAYRSSPTRDREIPHEDAEPLHKLFSEHQVRRILDLGCGDGRHLHFYGRLGYEICGLDYAPTAIRLARQWLAEEGLSAELVCAKMTTIPWVDESFDAVICFQVINHGLIEGIRRTIREIYRVLRDGGWLFVTVSTCKPPGPIRFRPSGIEVEPGTIVLTEEREKGVPHHFFTLVELLDEFSQFSLVDLHWDSRSRACVLVQKRD